MPSSPENALDVCEQESDVMYYEAHSDTFQRQYRGYNKKDMEVLIVERYHCLITCVSKLLLMPIHI